MTWPISQAKQTSYYFPKSFFFARVSLVDVFRRVDPPQAHDDVVVLRLHRAPHGAEPVGRVEVALPGVGARGGVEDVGVAVVAAAVAAHQQDLM